MPPSLTSRAQTLFYLQTCTPPLLPPLWRLFLKDRPEPWGPRFLSEGQPDVLQEALATLVSR